MGFRQVIKVVKNASSMLNISKNECKFSSHYKVESSFPWTISKFGVYIKNCWRVLFSFTTPGQQLDGFSKKIQVVSG
jgi:hypothetical protein